VVTVCYGDTMSRMPWRPLLAGALGGAAGFAYYVFVGCDSG
jgi:hypothetical protein